MTVTSGLVEKRLFCFKISNDKHQSDTKQTKLHLEKKGWNDEEDVSTTWHQPGLSYINEFSLGFTTRSKKG
jgi:hypothetical protein